MNRKQRKAEEAKQRSGKSNSTSKHMSPDDVVNRMTPEMVFRFLREDGQGVLGFEPRDAKGTSHVDSTPADYYERFQANFEPYYKRTWPEIPACPTRPYLHEVDGIVKDITRKTLENVFIVNTAPAEKVFYELIGRPIGRTRPRKDSEDVARASEIMRFLVEAAMDGGASDWRVVRELHATLFSKARLIVNAISAIEVALIFFVDTTSIFTTPPPPSRNEPPYSEWTVNQRYAIDMLSSILKTTVDERFGELDPSFVHAVLNKAAESGHETGRGNIKADFVLARLAVRVGALNAACESGESEDGAAERVKRAFYKQRKTLDGVRCVPWTKVTPAR